MSDHTPIKKDDLIIWTVHDVAQYLRMSEANVYRLVKRQQLPVIRLGKTCRFRKDQIENLLNQYAESSIKKDGN